MSNFCKKDFDEVYGYFLPHFAELAKIAKKNNVKFSLFVYQDGVIQFDSTEVYKDQGVDKVTTHQASQGIDYISEGSQTTTVKGKQ